MKLLVIGGTRFVGRHFVTAAVGRGHEVTLFNRGTQAPVEGVETIQGDRHRDLAKLEGRRWDAVLDMCGFLPRAVKASAEALRNSVDVYVFVSSISVYADVSRPGVDETGALATLTQEQLDKANAIAPSTAPAAAYGDMYGGLKTLCEQAAEEAMPGRVLILRPGLIVGPYDYTDRFTYWVARVARGGNVLAPGRPQRHIQFIDARDLADWTVTMIEQKRTGVYNCNGLPGDVTMGNLLDECKAVSGSDASFVWVDEEFLAREQIGAWGELPLWLPESEESLKGFMFVKSDKAIEAGLTFRSLTETVADTLAWYQTTPATEKLKAGLDPEKEKRLLGQWENTSS
ncbi:MAG TPA: NAD-dependent epimerase/dehydratase family protein [Pyrinomonadaceae bacterium]|nr:NAD-dependent epimerase/dehydratase family protein [Pyrinomonadaceae bacterium]